MHRASRRVAPRRPAASAPTPVDELPRLRAALGSEPDAARQARRCDSVRVRRQQGPQAAARGGASARRRRRHADHVRRRAVESRARDGRGGRQARPALHSRRERRAAGAADRERAAGSAAGRRGALRRVTRGARAGDGRGGRRRLRATGRRPFVIPLGASTPLGAAAYALAVGELVDADRAARRHRPLDLVWRDAGRARRRLPAARARDARHRHQRRRSVADAGSRDSANPRGPRGAARGAAEGRSRTPADRGRRHASSATATASRPGVGRRRSRLCARTRGAVPRPDVYGEGHGRADRARPRAARCRPTGAVLAHRRTGGACSRRRLGWGQTRVGV